MNSISAVFLSVPNKLVAVHGVVSIIKVGHRLEIQTAIYIMFGVLRRYIWPTTQRSCHPYLEFGRRWNICHFYKRWDSASELQSLRMTHTSGKAFSNQGTWCVVSLWGRNKIRIRKRFIYSVIIYLIWKGRYSSGNYQIKNYLQLTWCKFENLFRKNSVDSSLKYSPYTWPTDIVY